MLLKNILRTKTVSLWGLGYLGYTTMLKLQNSGFNIIGHDVNSDQLKQFLKGGYPDKGQKAAWSRTGYVPKLDNAKIRISKNAKDLFESSQVHIITTPRYHYKHMRKDDTIAELADIFSKNLKPGKTAPLIIFSPVFAPGNIENYFVKRLKESKLCRSRDYYLGVWFRTDWNIEDFLTQKNKASIAGCCSKSLRCLHDLMNYIGVATVKLGSLKEAEIYVNCINSLQAMANDFIRQLALGYPSVNVKRISKLLFDNVKFDSCTLNMGTGGEKMTYAIDRLIKGSNSPGKLTLLKEFQNINISSVLSYGEYIKRKNYKSLSILGITYKGNQRDLTLSPSITLANYLIKNSVEVSLNDPFFSKEEIHRLIEGVKTIDFPGKAFSTDVLLLASDHSEYKYLSQAMLDKMNIKTKLIIDNYGIWSGLKFGNKVRYHQIGDGSLDI